MNISKDLKKEAIALKERFIEINAKYNNLDQRLQELSIERNNLMQQLEGLRQEESELINKIEKEIGSKLTVNFANEILNE